jgi:hypothetical protein
MADSYRLGDVFAERYIVSTLAARRDFVNRAGTPLAGHAGFTRLAASL